MDTKTCRSCSRELSLDSFWKHATNKDGLWSKCRDCAGADGRIYELQRRYGISTEQYEELYRQQDGTCALCKEKDIGKSLTVDHDHSTGEIRGLLCAKCNIWLGNHQELLQRSGGLGNVLSYLTPNDNWSVARPIPYRYKQRVSNGRADGRKDTALPRPPRAGKLDEKVCLGCGIKKPLEEFTITDKARGYRKARCKPCEAARVAIYYASNESYCEATKERARAWDLARKESGAPVRQRRRSEEIDHEDIGV